MTTTNPGVKSCRQAPVTAVGRRNARWKFNGHAVPEFAAAHLHMGSVAEYK